MSHATARRIRRNTEKATGKRRKPRKTVPTEAWFTKKHTRARKLVDELLREKD